MKKKTIILLTSLLLFSFTSTVYAVPKDFAQKESDCKICGGTWENNTCSVDLSKCDESTTKYENNDSKGINKSDVPVNMSCTDPDIQKALKVVKTVYNLIRYITPVIVVLMGSVDFLQATLSGNENDIDKHKKKFYNRIFIAIILFLVLSLFELVANILDAAGVADSKSWLSCFSKL